MNLKNLRTRIKLTLVDLIDYRVIPQYHYIRQRLFESTGKQTPDVPDYRGALNPDMVVDPNALVLNWIYASLSSVTWTQSRGMDNQEFFVVAAKYQLVRNTTQIEVTIAPIDKISKEENLHLTAFLAEFQPVEPLQLEHYHS